MENPSRGEVWVRAYCAAMITKYTTTADGRPLSVEEAADIALGQYDNRFSQVPFSVANRPDVPKGTATNP